MRHREWVGAVRSEGFVCSSKLVGQSRGLDEDAFELFGDRRLRVGLMEDMVAPSVPPEDAGGRQLFEVSGYGALGDSGGKAGVNRVSVYFQAKVHEIHDRPH